MSYRTIKNDGECELNIKKSRFICQVFRIESEEAAREKLVQVKKQHYKATHNCSAFTLGLKQEVQRFSDDGEPSGTAGLPMLEVLKKLEIVNCLAVVTRYFGGVKLGSGGLIRAYGNAVNEAIHTVGIVENILMRQVKLTLSYNHYNLLENFSRTNHYTLENIQFTENVSADIYIDESQASQLLLALTELFNAQIDITLGEVIYREIDKKETTENCNLS
ncbi:MAG: YigZ family protein [Streptococcaceae bacterium]|nr:YigZ family protein [Streptococcaceae bacterium]